MADTPPISSPGFLDAITAMAARFTAPAPSAVPAKPPPPPPVAPMSPRPGGSLAPSGNPFAAAPGGSLMDMLTPPAPTPGKPPPPPAVLPDPAPGSGRPLGFPGRGGGYALPEEMFGRDRSADSAVQGSPSRWFG